MNRSRLIASVFLGLQDLFSIHPKIFSKEEVESDLHRIRKNFFSANPLTENKNWARRLYFVYGHSRSDARTKTNLTANQMRKAISCWNQRKYLGKYQDGRGSYTKQNMLLK